MNQNLKTVLHMVGDILADPKRRCTGTLAVDRDGFPTDPNSTVACAWCLSGALEKVMKDLNIEDTSVRHVTYNVMKETIGLDQDQAAYLFWDSNESMHDTIANKLRFA